MYLAAVIGCAVFCWAYQEWLAWLALSSVLCGSIAVLLISLPKMLRLRLQINLPERVAIFSAQNITLHWNSKQVIPPFRCKMQLENCITGERRSVADGDRLPTEHCGKWVLHFRELRIYDYFGLFFHRIPMEDVGCLVWPQARPIPDMPELEQYLIHSWVPKAGGGFSENHELRDYRPGDSMNQVHWKLTAKTGRLIVREPLVPADKRTLVDLVFRGTGEELDAYLGYFLWISRELLNRERSFEARILTREGVRKEFIAEYEDVEKLIEWVLGQKCAEPGKQLPADEASWYLQIGGDMP